MLATDDWYEPNDSLQAPHDFSNDASTNLSSINGLGVQLDDDWYMIFVDPQVTRVIVLLDFSHAAGDLDVELLDSSGNVLSSAVSGDNDENINYVVPNGGYYYIKVYGYLDIDTGNSYDLSWDDQTP